MKILAIDDKRDNLTVITALLNNLMPECSVIAACAIGGAGGAAMNQWMRAILESNQEEKRP